MKLTIQSIIRFEQLRNKPFSSIDYTDIEDLKYILYAVEYDGTATYEVFSEAMRTGGRIFESSISKLKKDIEVQLQFQPQSKEKGNPDDPVFIKDIIPILILEGMDADYVLNKMPFSDIPMYLDAYDKIRREKMESERLWTYLSMQPHLTKKLKPEDICPFPWEAERIKEEADRNIRENEEAFNRAMQMKFNKKWQVD